jgi:hypothetical protein
MDIRHLVLVVSFAVVVFAQGSRNLPMIVDPDGDEVAVAGYQTDVTLHFEGDPPDALEIVRLARSPGPAGWHVADRVSRPGSARAAVVRAPAGAETLLVVSAPGRAGYLLDGPFRWPSHPSTRAVSSAWRRTVRGMAPEPGGTLTWVGATETPADAWPQCVWRAGSAWECVGVPLGLPGVVIAGATGQFYAFAPGAVAAPGVEMTYAREAAWGRVVVVGRTDRAPLTVADAVTASPRRIVVPRTRPRSLRLQAEGDERIVIQGLGPHVFWVGGREAPEGTWVEVAATGRAPVRVNAADLAAAPAGLPVFIHLEPAGTIGGRVIADDGVAVPDSVLTLWRVLPPAAGSTQPDDDPLPRRIFVSETTSDADGRFGFTGLAEDVHEIVALHPARGRGEVRLVVGEREADVRVKRPAAAIGQVVRNGQAAGGVPVMVVPDLQEAAASQDLTQIIGGQERTGSDGRFQVAVPAVGRSEVRIGDGGTIRRFPLSSSDQLPSVVDLGVIELDAAAITVRLVLEGADGCEVRLSGPLGRSGVSLVRSQRIGPSMFEAAVPEPGQWLVSATCARGNRTVQPTSIDVPGKGPLTVPLVWR